MTSRPSYYGTPAHEGDGLLSAPRRSSSLRANVLLGLNVAIAGALGLVGVSMHTSHARFEALSAKMDVFLSQAPEANLHAAYRSHAVAPSKYAVRHVTPRKDQSQRGTCWDFATIGVLEQSYRAHGLAHGWLEEDEYVSFSEQAYGIAVMELCAGPPSSPQQVACRVAGDSMWKNSTEGGEVGELYYLQHGLANAVFPYAICPYIKTGGNDSTCPGLTSDRRHDNPLKFKVRSMDTWYDDMTIKARLFEQKKAMALSTPVTYVTHYYPCIGEFASDPHCTLDHCTLCPSEMSATSCCVPLKGGRNRNMEGEFFSHRGMTIEGGHAMLLVGYNDAFMTRDGFTGGFVVKNSWLDGPTQGSHSLNYWMQEHSDWEERVVCPNSYNPFNWYQCGNDAEPVVAPRNMSSVTTAPPTEAAFNRTKAFNGGINACLSKETLVYAEINYQPLHLVCLDERQCSKAANVTYFVKNTTDWGDRMTIMCVWEYSPALEARAFCLKPMLEVDIAKTLTPVPSEVRSNDPDRCGFYFMPYEAIRRYIAQFQGFYVNAFDIEWHPQSYLRHKAKYPHLNYDLLTQSTAFQHADDFDGPFPFAKVVDGPPN
ncbi:hypothetical protein SDRG_10587 [Saprolegnia diclina VS20]|uniref:Peptidase C1A papain C-terminal domain-containing protein n=1 Tax=Saprolegnia diclina (strain VS20) TaxID=1156394 RepID=T0RHK6_SAPDV|nr:hypothetical protein SDRG_10587 [Saprolegnia diclina VS20]EQC31798.1 hypothetical protein SDRG_10587 [Saprolegnia diclina VS20]|eukprot:XP_008614805.1 hypothetical protein SDRG_10587 [Saprolegnia diclina VS20]